MNDERETAAPGAPSADLSRRTRRTALWGVVFVGVMVGMAYAAVPLYRLFCQVTGFGGTPLRAEAVDSGEASAADIAYGAFDAVGCPAIAHDDGAYDGAVDGSEREITVFFDANLNSDMPWVFEPMVSRMTVRVGEPQIMCYRAHNPTDQPVRGMATFNVEPEQMGGHFVKIDCFCFQDQLLQPGESVIMPVYYFVHTDILEDDQMMDQQTVTLSYTFFRRDDLASVE